MLKKIIHGSQTQRKGRKMEVNGTYTK